MKKLNNKNSFKTPEGYFDGLADSLKSKLAEESSSIPKQDGFELPEGYFESLNKKISAKIKEEEIEVIKLNPYKNYYVAAASIAAVILIVFGLQTYSPSEQNIEDLANADIELYFENNSFTLDSYDLAELIPVEQLELDDFTESTIKNEQISDYLDYTIDDFNELNIE